MKRIKDDELIRIKRETSVIQDDLNMVENLLENIQQMKIVEGDQDNKDSSNDQDKAAIVPSIVKTEGNYFNLFLFSVKSKISKIDLFIYLFFLQGVKDSICTNGKTKAWKK